MASPHAAGVVALKVKITRLGGGNEMADALSTPTDPDTVGNRVISVSELTLREGGIE
jgi:hypothetical protein